MMHDDVAVNETLKHRTVRSSDYQRPVTHQRTDSQGIASWISCYNHRVSSFF
jgi:hypothetical protein